MTILAQIAPTHNIIFLTCFNNYFSEACCFKKAKKGPQFSVYADKKIFIGLSWVKIFFTFINSKKGLLMLYALFSSPPPPPKKKPDSPANPSTRPLEACATNECWALLHAAKHGQRIRAKTTGEGKNAPPGIVAVAVYTTLPQRVSEWVGNQREGVL